MKARWIIVGVLLGPFAILLAIFLADELLDRCLVVDKGPVGGKIRRAALIDGTKSIDIAKLTDFDWTEFEVYGPYETRGKICAEEGLRWLECRNVPSIIEEGEWLLFFRTAQNSVYMERHELNEGDFTNSGAPRPVLPARAVFEIALEVRDREYPPWVLLKWKP
jgi:hypothetical protein